MSALLTKFVNYVYQCLIVTGASHCIVADEGAAVGRSRGRDPASSGVSHREGVQTPL